MKWYKNLSHKIQERLQCKTQNVRYKNFKRHEMQETINVRDAQWEIHKMQDTILETKCETFNIRNLKWEICNGRDIKWKT